MIRVDIQSKSFGASPVLGQISFEIVKGETVALVGPSGIGKSTILRIVAGIDTDFRGRIDRPDSIAIVFQEPTLLLWRSVRDNLRIVHPELDRRAVEAALDQVGLSGKADLFPGQLSLGQQRRLALSRAFAGKPELLIMDEPYVSLDQETAQTMLRLTDALIAEHKPATLFVTHSMQEASHLADRVLTLGEGPDGATLD